MEHPRHPASRHPVASATTARRLADRFEIVRWLGEGGMGTVYLARDEKFDRRVAVKVLLGGEPEALGRFKQEFRALADISHPNLIVLHELFCEQNSWLFTMDYVEGRDLLSHVSKLEGRDAPTLLESEAPRSRDLARYLDPRPTRCPLRDEALLRKVLLQLTDAVHSLHCAGKLHLDLKPSNVLVTADDHVVVLDFGLARDLDQPSARSTERLLGTPAYMAPEHAEGLGFEPASDWYAVGVMLYEALTGQLPFEGPIAHILLSKTSRDPDPPRALCVDVPPHLEALCMQLLARDPAQRAGAAEIMAALGATQPPTSSSLRWSARATGGSAHSRALSTGELFVGQQHVLARLAAQSERAQKPRIMLLHGRSGVGKSTVAKRFLDQLAARPRTLVLRGACYEREAMPYKAFDGIVDALIAALEKLSPLELGALLPRHAHTLLRLFPAFALLAPAASPRANEDDDPELGRARAFRAFAELFARLSDHFEVVLFMDDLHWSDLDSALLMRTLFEGAEPVPLLLLGTYRAEQASASPLLEVLRELSETSSRLLFEQAEVGALDGAEAEALAHTLLLAAGRPERSLAAQIASESQGVPLFIHELVRHVAQRDEQGRRISLGELLEQRIAQLPKAAAELLTVLAVAGSPTAQRVLFRAARLSSGESAALHTLRVAGLAKSRGGRPEDALEAAHERVREVVLQPLSAERAAALHAQLLAALELEPAADDEQLYRHSLGAGQLERALHHGERAAQRAQRALAFHRSAELYRSALELEERSSRALGRASEAGSQGALASASDARPARDPSRRAALLEGLAEALAASGHCLDAAQAFLDAAALSPRAALAGLERKAADQMLRGGDIERGTELLARVLERVGVSYPKSARAALAALAFERARLFTRGLAFEERAVETIADSELELLASLKVSLGVYWLIEPVRGALFATIFLRHALDVGHARHVLRGLETEAAYVSLMAGAKGEARALELYKTARALTARIGSASTQSGYKLAEAGFHAIYGRKQKSSECALAALASPKQQGLSWERAYAHFHVYQNALYIGGRAGLVEEVAECVREAEARRDRFAAATLLPMLALTSMMADQPARAHEALARMRPMLSREVFSFLDLQELIWSALAHQYGGDSATALRLYAGAADRYALSGMPRLSTWRLLHAWGLLLAHLGALQSGQERSLHVRAAQQRIRAIERERIAWPLPFASMARAALHHVQDEAEQRDRLLLRAIRESEALGYTPFTLLFARAAAQFRGDGAALAKHDAELMKLGIASPALWQRTWAPCLFVADSA